MQLDDDDKQWIEDRNTALADRLIEHMRDMQTELLRGFATHSEGVTIRLRKLEVDHSNLDAAASGRIEVVERRLMEIEKRLGII
jgi:hypothetical protein